LAGAVVDQADGKARLQFPAAGLGQLPAQQPGADEVQLGLLCRPRRYADQGRRPPAVDGMRPDPVGIIYRLLT
jgi:hypothetical protein